MIKHHTFNHFLADLRSQVLSEDTANAKLSASSILQANLCNISYWIEDRFFTVDAEEGFVGHIIHQEDDHKLCIVVTAWQPRRGAPPHNHGTWAVITGMAGRELNKFWDVTGSGEYLSIKHNHSEVCEPGKVMVMEENEFHSVWNHGDDISLTLQIYGMHPNYTDRMKIDPDTGKTEMFICPEVTV